VSHIPARTEVHALEQEPLEANALKAGLFVLLASAPRLAFLSLPLVVGLFGLMLSSSAVISGKPGVLLLLVISLLFTAAGGYGVRNTSRQIQQTQALYAAAAPLRVRVTATTLVKQNESCALEYRYVDEEGQLHYCQSSHVSPWDARMWHPGDVAHILVNCNHPENSVLVSKRPEPQAVMA
jgi:hypothetical protein